MGVSSQDYGWLDNHILQSVTSPFSEDTQAYIIRVVLGEKPKGDLDAAAAAEQHRITNAK